ncbi:hypothetical protein BU24DRAFT_417458 [Aaosphaeria arxii CBS 175.79]|uniref:Uncharacterized protein n=1 Tax=Aaosphaeria arxii CBS 175.79 TaxID=1450172 RepID=A0A6A5YAK2_9PLEO|nr:uncharacterized protein BU24DRAFT_417458 [Aaosphaeria arxii CBS 175.79]KAF2021820.1 hypothetical protein BU24DRAFT_417458 [Aaosphaeria arxii CBS 175.79]
MMPSSQTSMGIIGELKRPYSFVLALLLLDRPCAEAALACIGSPPSLPSIKPPKPASCSSREQSVLCAREGACERVLRYMRAPWILVCCVSSLGAFSR